MARHFKEPQSKTNPIPTPVSRRNARGSQEQQDKKNSRKNLVSNILTIVGVLLLLVSGGIWLYNQSQYYIQDQEVAKLAQYAEVTQDENRPPKVDWKGLKEINGDVVAWIQIPGTPVNYPVYQGKTNDTYLRTLADGSYGIGGLIFLDSDNQKPGMIDQQSIVYGHHLKNGAMFKRVADMDNQEVFDSIKTVWYVTEEKAYELEPLFLYYTHPEDLDVLKFNFPSEDALHTYLKERFTKAVTHTQDVQAKLDKVSRVLTLSTCNYIDGFGRSELVCGIKSEVDTV